MLVNGAIVDVSGDLRKSIIGNKCMHRRYLYSGIKNRNNG